MFDAVAAMPPAFDAADYFLPCCFHFRHYADAARLLLPIYFRCRFFFAAAATPLRHAAIVFATPLMPLPLLYSTPRLSIFALIYRRQDAATLFHVDSAFFITLLRDFIFFFRFDMLICLAPPLR